MTQHMQCHVQCAYTCTYTCTMYSTRQTQGITHARFTRVSHADCTRVALRLHACHKLIACVSHAFDMGAEKRVCPGGPLASVRAFARRGRTCVFGLLCYDHASTTSCKTTTILVLPSMTTPQLQDLFGLL